MVDFNRWKNFSFNEFVCRCGCGKADMNAQFMDGLQHLRTNLKFPFVITSGFRCPEYNNRISHTGYDGPHTTGHAADISIYGFKSYALIKEAMHYGMTGIGIHQKGGVHGRFVHLDDLNIATRPWVWTY